MSRFSSWIFTGLASVALAVVASAYPSVFISIPSSVVQDEGYTGSVDAWDDMGELQTLSVSRNGSYYGSASGWGWCTYLGVPISDSSSTAGTVSYFAAVDSASYSAYGSASITILANNPPIGSYDAVSASAPTYGSISASGWAADFETLPIASVKYYIDGNYAGVATWGDSRPDVAAAFGKPNWYFTGFHLSFSASGLGIGTHSLKIVAFDKQGLSGDLGTKNFEIVNTAPTAAMSIKGATSGTVSAVTGETLTITVSGSDVDGNLRAVNLWVATPNTAWRNIRSDSSINGGFVENNTSDNAISSGGANVGSLGAANRTFYIPLSEGVGTYQFVVRSIDAYTNSGSQQVNVTVTDPPPVNQSVTVGSTFTYGQAIPMSTRSTDPNGDMAAHHIVVSNASYTTNNWEGSDTSGWKWHHFMSVGAANGSDSTVSFNLHDDNYGQGTNLPAGTYHVTINGQDALPNYTYDASRIMATFTITKATPTITWGTPSPIYYGTALSATQLNATASVPGTFSYTPNFGIYPQVGNNKALTVTFTPTDTANYNSTTATVYIDVLPAGQIIALTPSSPVTLYFGQSQAYNVTGGLTDLVWGGAASGSGYYKTITLPAVGTFSVSVYASAQLSWSQSNTVTTTLTALQTTPVVRTDLFPATKAVTVSDTYAVTSADLGAIFVNPYSLGVDQPTGAISYTISNDSPIGTYATVFSGQQPVSAGTTLRFGTYVIRATIAATTNYAATTATMMLVVFPNAGGDADNDGMPNGWEMAHGLNPYDPADAAQDADGDGASNLTEYICNLDPQNPNDATVWNFTYDRMNQILKARAGTDQYIRDAEGNIKTSHQ